MRLANLEKAFMGHLLHPHASESKFLAELLPLNKISKDMQLSIYRDNMSGAYQKALNQIYPACMNVLGEKYFQQLCRIYFFECPSTNADLNFYGEFFSVFIKEQVEERNELNEFYYLSELANLEWHWHASYFAEDDDDFSFEKLSLVKKLEQGKIIFSLNHSFSLHATMLPLLDIWNANKGVVKANQEFKMPNNKNYFCINRADCTLQVDELHKEEYVLLKKIMAGLSLEEISHLCVDIDLQSSIMKFIQKGWISRFEIKS